MIAKATARIITKRIETRTRLLREGNYGQWCQRVTWKPRQVYKVCTLYPDPTDPTRTKLAITPTERREAQRSEVNMSDMFLGHPPFVELTTNNTLWHVDERGIPEGESIG